MSNIYILNSVDRVFTLSINETYVKPGDVVTIRIVFKPNIVGQSFTEYYIIDDTGGNTYRLTVTGKCYGKYFGENTIYVCTYLINSIIIYLS